MCNVHSPKCMIINTVEESVRTIWRYQSGNQRS